jgi:hypothetical protein
VILTLGNGAALVTYLEIFALLVGAMVHDLGHPGVSNAFEINSKSDLALTYNDKSVLENFHCWQAFSLLKKPDCNILEGLSAEEHKTFRTLVINSVLSTDLAHHMDITSKWNAIKMDFKKEDSNHRTLLLQIILKCSDVSNPGKTFEQAKYWAEMVQEEFFAQGDLEKERNLPVSAFMDREKPDLAKMQLNFIDYLVLPLFSTISGLLPPLDCYCQRLADNKEKWIQIKDNNSE